MGVVLVVHSNLEDELMIRKLQTYINYLVEYGYEEYAPNTTNTPESHSHRIKRRKIQTGRKFKLDALVDGCDIKYVMLDLGLDANILPEKY
jgi:hypothetical protein